MESFIQDFQAIKAEFRCQVAVLLADLGKTVSRVTADGAAQNLFECIGHPLEGRVHDDRPQAHCEPRPDQISDCLPVLPRRDAGSAEFQDNPRRPGYLI